MTHSREPAMLSAGREHLSNWVVRICDPVLTALSRHWLLVANSTVALVLGGAIATPLLLASGQVGLAAGLMSAYQGICHQWAFRSFFLLGPSPIYSQPELERSGVDPFRFAGSQELGWKMAFCERDFGIFAGALLFGLIYAWRRNTAAPRPASYLTYSIIILPMAVDGFTQLFGWRESTWELRVATGLLFGFGSAWLIYPRLDAPAQRSRMAAMRASVERA